MKKTWFLAFRRYGRIGEGAIPSQTGRCLQEDYNKIYTFMKENQKRLVTP